MPAKAISSSAGPAGRGASGRRQDQQNAPGRTRKKETETLEAFHRRKSRAYLAVLLRNPMERRSCEVKIDILATKYLQTFEEDSVLEIIPPEYCSGGTLRITYYAYYGTLFPSELTDSFCVQAVPQNTPHELQ